MNLDFTPEELAFEQEVFVSVVVGDEARAGMNAAQDQYEQGSSIAEANDK